MSAKTAEISNNYVLDGKYYLFGAIIKHWQKHKMSLDREVLTKKYNFPLEMGPLQAKLQLSIFAGLTLFTHNNLTTTTNKPDPK